MGAIEPVVLGVPGMPEVFAELDTAILSFQFAAVLVVLARPIGQKEECVFIAAHEAHDALKGLAIDAVHVNVNMKTASVIDCASVALDGVNNLSGLEKIVVGGDDGRSNLVTTRAVGLEIPVRTSAVAVVASVKDRLALASEVPLNPVERVRGGGEFNFKSNLAE
jgi:hypothetical protein